MIKRISSWIKEISNGTITITFAVIMILFMIFVLPVQAEKSQEFTGSSKSPDTSFYYTPDELFHLADDYGPNGRQYYIHNRWTFDLVFPLVFVGFLTTGISWFYKHIKDGSWTRLNIIPLFAGIFDYFENIAASIVMAAFPNRLVNIAFLSSTFSIIRWLLVFGSFLIYFWGLIQYLLSKLKSKNSP